MLRWFEWLGLSDLGPINQFEKFLVAELNLFIFKEEEK